MNPERQRCRGGMIPVPAPTGWPMTAAFGFTLVFFGLITHMFVSILGAVTLVMGLIGWFRAVLPRAAQELVPVEADQAAVATRSRDVSHLQIGQQGHRARLP